MRRYPATLAFLMILGSFAIRPAGASEPDNPYPLWDASRPVPERSRIPQLEGVRFHTIKARRPDVDGFNWLHGVAIAWHKDRLFATCFDGVRGERAPLTIAVTEPGDMKFSRLYTIREAVHDGPGESDPGARLSYPYAVERDGHLYVAYSNDGDRGGNRNSAELAIIPIERLRAE